MAGRLLGVDHSTVSRKLESLEAELGGPLFERGPNGFTATSLGEEVAAAAEFMEDATVSLMRRLEGASVGLSGTVRVTTTPILANLVFAPALREFWRDYPSLDVELVGVDRSLDLSRREADIAVRMSRSDVPGLVVKRLNELAFAFYARERNDRDFQEQRFLIYEDEAGSAALQKYQASLIKPAQVVMRSNSLQALLAAAASGFGCALLPCFAAEGTTLVRVPAPNAMPTLTLWLHYHEDLRRSPRVKAAVKFIGDVMGRHRDAMVPPGFQLDNVT